MLILLTIGELFLLVSLMLSSLESLHIPFFFFVYSKTSLPNITSNILKVKSHPKMSDHYSASSSTASFMALSFP